ncbi:MAG: hypothetical protein OSJ39_04665 [Clostridia bacterium]|nr:hypothetical protein [Clostridia bacterium]
MSNFDENKHPRASDGKFTDGNDGNGGNDGYSDGVNERIKWANENGIDLPLNADGSLDDLKLQKIYEEKTKQQKMEPAKKVVEVDMDADVQKRLSAAETPKERQKIAFQYIMDNLRGQYEAPDGRTVAIERVGADKMTYRDNRDKLRVCPALADMIKSGEYDHSSPADEKPNKKFNEFAYYKVRVKIGDEVYTGMLNVGIRKDGSSTLYDLRPFYKENK